MTVGLVLVSHVERLADGVRELAGQMAPDVPIAAAGGTDEGGVGTSFEKVLGAVAEVDSGAGVVVLYDLGSALMTAELVLETLDPEQAARVRLVDAPLVEGALAAATTAQGGADLAAVVAAAAGERAGVPSPVPPDSESGEALTTRTTRTTLRNPLGLHARPAADLARMLAALDAQVLVGPPGAAATDARSVLATVGLGLRGGADLEIVASGPDAQRALDGILRMVEDGFGEGTEAETVGRTELSEVSRDRERDTSGNLAEAGVMHGVAGSPGVAVGPVVRLRAAEPELPGNPAGDPAAERAALEAALVAVDADLAARARATTGAAAGIASAHRALLADPGLRDKAFARLAEGAPAAAAWWQAVQSARALLAGGVDDLVAERAADVDDVGRQVLAALGVEVRRSFADVRGAVVVAEDVVPSDVPDLAAGGAAGLAVGRGGRTAHATIIARGLGLPTVVALGAAVEALADGTTVVLDGTAGTVHVDPPADVVLRVKQSAEQERARRETERAAARGPVLLPDGRRILVAANIGSRAEAVAAVDAGADGVGLLRTELLFVDRGELPGEDEQTAELGAILDVLGDRQVVVRTLDVGGDKLLPALRLDPWRHGPLGERGLRYGLTHPDVLRTQLRAILRSAYGRPARVAVMAPMVTVAEEARAFVDLVAEVAADLERDGVPYARPAEVGVMVEVPAAALAAEQICAAVDFVSIGSNDLLQYVMAAERTNDAVAHLYRPDHPALWRVVEQLLGTARAAGCRVAACGEIAGDPETAGRLVELGIDELSAAPASVPAVKAALRAAPPGQR